VAVPPPGQRLEADVIVVREFLPVEKTAFSYLIAHSGGKVRLGNEADQWRLIDLEAEKVTFIDETSRSYRTESLASLRNAQRRSVLRPLPQPFQPLTIVRTEDSAVIAGRQAVKHVLEGGGYRRQIWLSTKPLLNPNLYGAILASETLSEPFAGLMREATPRLIAQQGFPLRDESELAFGDKKLSIVRTVSEIGRRQVPASWFSIPAGYEDRGIKVPDADRRSGASRPSDRDTRAAGSQSSSTN